MEKNMMCNSVILSSKGNSTISYCRKCQNHYVWQNSFILTFNPQQYDCFVNEIKQKVGQEEYLAFPDGVLRMIMTTPVPEILFTFTDEEWADFIAALNEAYYMREVYQLIH